MRCARFNDIKRIIDARTEAALNDGTKKLGEAAVDLIVALNVVEALLTWVGEHKRAARFAKVAEKAIDGALDMGQIVMARVNAQAPARRIARRAA